MSKLNENGNEEVNDETAKAPTKQPKVVTMEDGRVVDFGVRGKLKKVIEIIGEEANKAAKITMDCVSGQTFVVTLGVDHVLALQLLAHGFSQKVGDAITKLDEPEDIGLEIKSILAKIERGEWSQRESSGLGKGMSVLIEAIRRVKGYDAGSVEHENIKTALLTADADTIKLYKTNSRVKGFILLIESEKAAERSRKLLEESEEADTSEENALENL